MITGCVNRDTFPPKSTRTLVRTLLAVGLLTAVGLVLTYGSARAQLAISDGRNVIDFGCVGMDFKVFSNFHLINRGATPVKVKSINVPCDCSEVWISDSTITPGDSVRVRLSFDTKNLYGKTIRAFKIYTNDPKAPTLEYVYHSLVGQWPFGLRPDPTSVFFLPGVRAREVALRNPLLDNVVLTVLDQADTLYTIKVVSAKAVKGGKAVLEVTPRDGIQAGTYLSSFRVRLQPADSKETILMTIPVKIVRY
jgi:hypothetical protein